MIFRPIFFSLLVLSFFFSVGGCGEDTAHLSPGAYIEIEEYFKAYFGLIPGNIYWGEFHAHTNYSKDAALCNADGPETAYTFACDPKGVDLDFVGLSDHAEFPNEEAVPKEDPNIWQSLLRIGEEFNNEDPASGKVFIVFPGWEYTNTHGLQWCTSSTGYGHKNIVFKDFDHVTNGRYAACLAQDPLFAEDATELWSKLAEYRPEDHEREGKALTIVHTPAHSGPTEGGEPTKTDHQTDWDVMDSDFVRHVEIASKWGSSEGPCPDDADCLIDDPPIEYLPEETVSEKTIRPVLYQRWVLEGDERFLLGFLGGTDNHMGHPANYLEDYCDPAMHFLGAMTGLASPALTRDNLWTDLWRRHTIACSTGKKIPILMAVHNGRQHLLMGDRGTHEGWVTVRVLSSPETQRIDLLVDGCLIKSVFSGIMKANIPLKEGRHYIYTRARVETIDRIYQAWSSPVYLSQP